MSSRLETVLSLVFSATKVIIILLSLRYSRWLAVAVTFTPSRSPLAADTGTAAMAKISAKTASSAPNFLSRFILL